MKGLTICTITEAVHGVYYENGAAIQLTQLQEKENAQKEIIHKITTDSRKVETGDLFFAIRGERSDGHDYIASVYEKGAALTISEKVLENETHPYIHVTSTLQALKDLAEYYRSVLDLKVVGITGSVGKTSTKETIASVLSEKYKVLKTQGNFNNEIGLPLTVFRLTTEDEIAVLEMGISNFGEMTRLTRIAKPDICVITNIGCCHLENLKDRDGILKAKTEIFRSMAKDGTVILNGDDDKLITVGTVNQKPVWYFGVESRQNFYADEIEDLGLEGERARIHITNPETGEKNAPFTATIPVSGRHMVLNALAATAVATCLGLTPAEIADGLEKVQTIAGRNNQIRTEHLLILDDCYNANPVSMRSSIDVISHAETRKVLILGDMFELGENEKQLHYDTGAYAASKKPQLILTAGTLCAELARAVKEHDPEHAIEVHHYPDLPSLLDDLPVRIHAGDTILVKASHGMHFTEVVKKLQELTF